MKKNWFIVVLVALFFAPASAQQADDLRAGVDYIDLQPQRTVRVAADKIEVREFFNFSCPHCNRLQGYFNKWRADNKGDDVVIIHQPVTFARYNGHFARVYYTLEALGIVDEYNGKVYNAIHSQRTLLNSKGRFMDWLEENGIDVDKAEAVYDSFSVKSHVARSESITNDYGVNSTPQISIAGKYLLTPSLSRSYERLMEVLTLLVERERQLLLQPVQ